MSKIKVLDELTVQQIAAGEVIERPASIVKELLENSLDAGAKNIIVEIKNGGKSFIRVTDDGEGIREDEVELAFKRHSTSKLEKAEDLYNINSLGFRGEALASIATVSRVKIMTKTIDAQVGIEAGLENGNIIKKKPVGTPTGTTIIVKDLFYNLPVRRDFLKSDLVETNRISDIIYKISLGNPDRNIRYIKDNQNIFSSSSNQDLLNHIYNILGRDFAKNMKPLSYEDRSVNIEGYISNNELFRGNRSHQYLFINGRYIEDKNIVSVIEKEYKSVIPLNRFPVFILFISIDPAQVDVNIHPTKQEVKFSNEDLVLESIRTMMKSSLSSTYSVPKISMSKNRKESKKTEPLLFHMMDKGVDNLDDVNSSPVELLDLRTPSKCSHDFNESYEAKAINNRGISRESKAPYNPDYFKEDKPNYFQSIKEKLNRDIIQEAENVLDKQGPQDEVESLDNLKLVGLLFKTYILAEDREKDLFFIIDQHAAHERVMYEKYLSEFKLEKVHMQQLLSPISLSLTAEEHSKVKANTEIFKKLGFEIEEFGIHEILIRSVPLIFGQVSSERIFYDILDNLNLNIESNYDTRLDKIMKIACVNSVKAGDSLSESEVLALFEQLKNTNHPYSCPHGRPTILKVSKREIEKEFLRIL